MATEMVRVKAEDAASRISVLESQVEDISADVQKLEIKIDANYSTLHHRISDLRLYINRLDI
jgi:chaperonin cofactor prefoldin